MGFLKILVVSLAVLSISTFSIVIPQNVSAEENELVAAVSTKDTTPSVQPQPKPKLDCKAVESKGKDGKIIVTLEGKGCKEVVKKIGASDQSKVCCICRGDGSGTHWVCDGTCCTMAIGKIVKITR